MINILQRPLYLQFLNAIVKKLNDPAWQYRFKRTDINNIGCNLWKRKSLTGGYKTHQID